MHSFRPLALSLIALSACAVDEPPAAEDLAPDIVDTPSTGTVADVIDDDNPDLMLDPTAETIPDADLDAVDAELASTDSVVADDDDGDVEDDDDGDNALADDLGAELPSADDIATAQLTGDVPPDDGEDAPSDADTTDVAADMLAAAQTKIPTPIRYVLIIVKENHTFDNYFTSFPGAVTSTHAYKYNKAKNKRIRFLRPLAPAKGLLPTAPGHTHGKALAAYRGGHMDGFSVNPGKTPYMRYTKSEIPNYWKYASEFVLADNFFSTTLGPSSPGHEVFWFSRSTSLDNAKCNLPGGKGCGHGCTGNHLSITTFGPHSGTTQKVKPCFDLPSLPDHLPAKFTWFDYGGQMAKQIKSQQDVKESAHYAPTDQLLKDLKNDKLHNLMIAHISGGPYSEHPPESVCPGENKSVEIINAAMKLPEWKHMAIIVTWDDWGGFYDHIKPRVDTANNGAHFGRGFRLPLIVISPYAKKGAVLHTRTEQASVPRLVEELWGMKMMHARNRNARDGIAGTLLGAFDFKQTPRAPIHLDTRTCP